MKIKYTWLIGLMPSINIIMMYIFEYIDDSFYWMSDITSNWGIQFLFIIIESSFIAVHYILTVLIPVLLHKKMGKFTNVDCLVAVNSFFIANVIMLVVELIKVGFNEIPQYRITTMCASMGIVILVSILIKIKQKRNIKLNR